MARPTTASRIRRMLDESPDSDPVSGCGVLPLGLIRGALGPSADSALLDLALEGLVTIVCGDTVGDVTVVG